MENAYPTPGAFDRAVKKAVRLEELRLAIESECAKRGMDVPERFTAPDFWKERFASFSKGKLPSELAAFDAASGIAARFFDPVLRSDDGDMSWDPDTGMWKD